MGKNKITAKGRVLNYMKDCGSITTWEAFTQLGITRLSEYIRQIRLEYEVTDEPVHRTNKYGEKVTFKRFYLGKKYGC